MYVIYQIKNKVNGKSYVGFTSRSLKVRWKEHIKRSSKGATQILSHSLRKYGASRHLLIVLEEGQDPKIGKDVQEPHWISVLKPEYNMTKGGDGTLGYTHSEGECLRRKARQQGSKHSPERCESNRLGHIGKTPTSQHRKNTSVAMIGKNIGPQRQITCPQCQASGGASVMRRWHFENCKNKL